MIDAVLSKLLKKYKLLVITYYLVNGYKYISGTVYHKGRLVVIYDNIG